MRLIVYFLLPFIPIPSSLFAQCGSTSCPPGAIHTLPAGGVIATGDTYCLSGTINNTTAYTVNGTLIIQSGSVTLGDLTVGKTGAIIVNGGGRLMANSYTGDASAPAAAISNVTVCTNGYLYLSGAINPGETNFSVNDYGMFVIHGSWSTIIGDTYFKLGMGSIVEMCSSFSFKSSTGFFTETSSGPSYMVTRSAMANGAAGGYLSKSGAASQIMWAIPGGPIAWVTHPAANTCTGSTCGPVLPPGTIDDGLCGSVANSYQLSILSLAFLHADNHLAGDQLIVLAEPEKPLPAGQIILEVSTDGVHFTGTVYTAVTGAGNSYQFTLPAAAAINYYRIRAGSDGASIYSNILPPLKDNSGQTRLFADPATGVVYIHSSPNEHLTGAVVLNCVGQVLQKIPIPADICVMQCELPASLPTGWYIIRLMRADKIPLTFRVLKSSFEIQ